MQEDHVSISMTALYREYYASEAVASLHAPYRSVFGMPKKKDFDKAIAEYQRRLGLDEIDIKVVVAQNVRVSDWLRSQLEVRSVKIHTVYNGDLCDVFITKVITGTHQSAVGEIARQLGNWDDANGLLLNGFSGIPLRFPTATREPDGVVSPDSDPNMPRLVVEVELYHWSLKGADKWAREYFGFIPKLQDLLLRNAAGAPTITDAVSFGSAPLCTIQDVMDTLGYQGIRVLQSPLNADGTRPPVSPWQPPSNPTITVPATDLFHLRTDPVTFVS
ncbi:hypothetical protein DYB35_009374 [Aphanomyces astaci]|uniref:Uncharacterized protein n=1 Tax=Aphanomyces astaci TaxID=112090 RepID=A0A418D262_APHAT|nr:hypothetical protein DYB35_009374 [Aphanomyces astaci]